MFGILKDKLSKAIKSISERLKEKEEPKPAVRSHEQLQPKEAEEKIKIRHEEEIPEIRLPEEEEKKIPEPRKAGRKEPKPAAAAEPKHEKKSFISKIFEKAVKTVTERKLEEKDLLPVLDELETDLIEADVAVEVAEHIKADLMKELAGKEIKRGGENEEIVGAFKRSLLGILDVPAVDLEKIVETKKPAVLLFLGFNGSGKTTSIAKVANFLKERGHTSVLAAGDSWRAAAIEQLEEHGNRIGVKVIKHNYGSDPAAVVYDAVEHAKSKGVDFVLADSAGRVHTNQNLMQELQKMVRVNKPDLKVLVIDSMTGNDALEQARAFGNVGVDAVIFTKVDVNEKGGAILSVTNELRKPILFLGMGQGYDDFEKFDAEKFVNRIVG
ncbi:MAG: signal recognition particle-docking protein FtsY [Candidatus Aenigmatarchaeota archaeon]